VADPVATIRAELDSNRATLAKLTEKAAKARASSDRVTPGGLSGEFDHGVLTRPRASHRARESRHATYDREAAASRERQAQERRVADLEKALSRAKADAKAPCDISGLRPGFFVRDRYGWHRVARVNKQSVSVETPFSWTERIALNKIIETRAPALKGGEAGV
jgi:hypothetical protein